MADTGTATRRSVLLGGVALAPLGSGLGFPDRAAAAPGALTGLGFAEPAADDEEFQSKLPRCDKLDGSTLHIVPDYTEGGWFCEANCVTISDGERTAVYIPLKIVEPGKRQ